MSVALVLIWVAAFFWSAAPLLGWGSYTGNRYLSVEFTWHLPTQQRYLPFLLALCGKPDQSSVELRKSFIMCDVGTECCLLWYQLQRDFFFKMSQERLGPSAYCLWKKRGQKYLAWLNSEIKKTIKRHPSKTVKFRKLAKNISFSKLNLKLY